MPAALLCVLRGSALQEGLGGLDVAVLHGLEALHGGGLGGPVVGLLHGPVDHAAEALLRQGAEVLELLLPDVAEEGGDLGIVD